VTGVGNRPRRRRVSSLASGGTAKGSDPIRWKPSFSPRTVKLSLKSKLGEVGARPIADSALSPCP